MAYAEKTDVPTDRSKAEIEKLLLRHGAQQFAYMADRRRAVLVFRIQNRQIKLVVPLPAFEEFRTTPAGNRRTADGQETAWEQACRARWRAVGLIVKAKLEAIQSGISSVEREFLPDIVMPNGQTVHEWTGTEIERAYITGKMPDLLPLLSA